MRVNSENEEKASVSSAGFAAQSAGSALVINALFFFLFLSSIVATCPFYHSPLQRDETFGCPILMLHVGPKVLKVLG